MTLSQASGGYSQDATTGPLMPALLTKICTCPKRASVWAKAASTEASDDTSTAWRSTGSKPFSVLFQPSTARSQITTWAPATCKRRAIARPMPRMPPVTIAVWPCRYWLIVQLHFRQ
ncbi:hypothetical protein D3C73_1358440 [compost metagenome]